MASKMATKTSAEHAKLIFMQKLNARANNCTARVARAKFNVEACNYSARAICILHGMYVFLPGLFRQQVHSILCGGGRLHFKEPPFFILQVVSTVLINLIPPEDDRLSICGKAKIAGKVMVSFLLCRYRPSIGESLLTSFFTFLLNSIRLT